MIKLIPCVPGILFRVIVLATLLIASTASAENEQPVESKADKDPALIRVENTVGSLNFLIKDLFFLTFFLSFFSFFYIFSVAGSIYVFYVKIFCFLKINTA